MATNFVKNGETLTLVAPVGGVVSGTPIVEGGLFVVPATSADEGDSYEGTTRGVFEFPKKAATAFADGDNAYWDATPGEVTDVSTDGDACGVVCEGGAAADDTTVKVQINGLTLRLGTPADGSVTTAKIAALAVTTAKIAADAITEAKIADEAVQAEHVKQVADAALGVPLLLRVACAGAGTYALLAVAPRKVRVVDAWIVCTNGTAGTLQFKNGATAITDDITHGTTDKAVVRAATIDDAQHEIAAAGALNVVVTTGGNSIAYALVIPVA